MSAAINLRGRRFGRLTVLRRGQELHRAQRRVKARWRCRYDCGRELLEHAASLVRGRPDQPGSRCTRSCGCWQVDLVGALHAARGGAQGDEVGALRAMEQSPERAPSRDQVRGVLGVMGLRCGYSQALKIRATAPCVFAGTSPQMLLAV
jgi:hypothetical protein